MRALLAAAALPCNRVHFLLRSHVVAGLATCTLASAIQAARPDACDAPEPEPATSGEGGGDVCLLPALLRLLRLLITPLPPGLAVRGELRAALSKLRADLVTLLVVSGGMKSLQEHCARRAATLAQATAHGALLRQYVALLHALLLPVHLSMNHK